MATSEHRKSLEQREVASGEAGEAGDGADAEALRAELGESRRALEQAGARERRLGAQVELLERRLLEVETDLAEAQHAARRAADLVGQIQATSSWRITAPVRAVSRLLRGS